MMTHQREHYLPFVEYHHVVLRPRTIILGAIIANVQSEYSTVQYCAVLYRREQRALCGGAGPWNNTIVLTKR